MEKETLSYLDDEARLKTFELLTKGVKHLWSKNKLMDGTNEITVKTATGQMQTIREDRLTPVLSAFATLAEKDPLFLAHFTSYAIRKLDDKDLKVVATFASTLSDADGTPFTPGGAAKKPNWRLVGSAAFQTLDPKLALRVVELANKKIKFGSKPEATHYSKHLRKALVKYLRFRENNPKALQGVVESGLTTTYRNLYRWARIKPSEDAARTLRWKQKDGSVKDVGESRFNFKGLSDVEVAEKIRAEGLKPQAVLGALGEKISPVVAAAVLEQASGDQAVVLTTMFEEQGLFKHKEVKKLYEDKLKTAKNALDRVDRINAELAEDTKKVLKETRSEKRKNDLGDFGRVYVHLDTSPSMERVLDIAKEYGSVICEFVKDPEKNFFWGQFASAGSTLPQPGYMENGKFKASFTKDGFHTALYGKKVSGWGTNCLALYKEARKAGATTDIYITDQEHNTGDMAAIIADARRDYPDPRMVIIVDLHSRQNGLLKQAFERAGIPVAVLKPGDLGESALVTQAVRTSFKGQTVVLDEILAEPLLTPPKWWFSVKGA